MINIAFLMPQLGGGGAERVISTILNHLDPDKYRISLILVHKKGNYLNKIPKTVNVILLNSSRTRYAFVEILKVLRKLEPDILFSTLRGLSLLALLMKPFLPKNTKIIIREENTVSVALKESKFRKFWEFYYRKIFIKADRIICQSNYMKEDLLSNYGVQGDHIVKIYNPVDFKMIEDYYNLSENPFPNNDNRNVVVIGRLAYQKGIDILLESIKQHKMKFKKINVWIIGDGISKEKYKEISNKYHLEKVVKFIDAVDNPFAWMKYSDLYMLTSRYEGLPNVLLEAAACNCQLIVTNHPGGTNEIMHIIDKQDYIVNELNWEDSWFNQTSKINHQKLQGEFSVDTIIKIYDKLFNELMGDNY